MQISDVFRVKLIKGYVEDERWGKIIKVLDDKASIEKKFNFDGEVVKLPFVRGESKGDEELIFHVDKFSGLRRLCIPKPLVKDIFNIAHNEGYPGFERCYEIVSKS